MGATALQTVYQTFDPDFPVTFHLPTLTTKTDTNTILMLYVIQKDRHFMPTSDYYFTNIQPDPIIIPSHRGNNSSSTPQQVVAKDRIPQQTDTLRPGETAGHSVVYQGTASPGLSNASIGKHLFVSFLLFAGPTWAVAARAPPLPFGLGIKVS